MDIKQCNICGKSIDLTKWKQSEERKKELMKALKEGKFKFKEVTKC